MIDKIANLGGNDDKFVTKNGRKVIKNALTYHDDD